LRAAVLIDYQNIHLTAHGCWAPNGLPVHESLIHPMRFGEQVLLTRSRRQRDERQKGAVLSDVFVFRGLPSNRRQPALYRVNQAQKSEWERDPRVHVTYRPLRYGDGWPSQPAQEKGIDVLVALNLVRIADHATHDIVILAAHDTDLEPALDMAAVAGRVKVETAGWEGCRRLRVPDHSLWHTALGSNEFVACRDRKDYTAYYNATPRDAYARG
jgi:uncharacterized LabA/DUF88 family protein